MNGELKVWADTKEDIDFLNPIVLKLKDKGIDSQILIRTKK